jgi:selenocysteine lyase/cysteine desulfurase
LEFAKSIGPDRIYARIHQLARMAFDRARQMPGLRLLTPDDDRMFGSLVAFDMPPAQFKKFGALCRERKIWIMMSERFRVSSHIHTRPEDIDLLFQTLEEARKSL